MIHQKNKRKIQKPSQYFSNSTTVIWKLIFFRNIPEEETEKDISSDTKVSQQSDIPTKKLR